MSTNTEINTERQQALFDVFTTACEGGINYWVKFRTYHIVVSQVPWVEDLDGFRAEVIDIEDGKEYVIDSKVIARGIRKAYADRQRFSTYNQRAITALNFGKYEDADYDAETADIIVQFGLLGEVIYG